jgi:hypothetical protein
MGRANHPNHAMGASSIAMITKAFIVAKDFNRIGVKIIRDHYILHDHMSERSWPGGEWGWQGEWGWWGEHGWQGEHGWWGEGSWQDEQG